MLRPKPFVEIAHTHTYHTFRRKEEKNGDDVHICFLYEHNLNTICDIFGKEKCAI